MSVLYAVNYQAVNKQTFNPIINTNWQLISIVIAIFACGIIAQISIANGQISAFAYKQLLIFTCTAPLVFLATKADANYLLGKSHYAYYFSLLLLIYVKFFGHKAMGAARWIKLGPINFQPSELSKTCMILALAQYFSNASKYKINRNVFLIPPAIIIAIPSLLVLLQPNLGTACIHIITGAAIICVSGIQFRKIAACIMALASCTPFLWQILKPYQKKRILTFINPSDDLLGSGYNVMQSKIAIGSGGMWGQGWMRGTQNQLNFLPEKQTDFIFTVFAEEFGFAGSVLVITLYIMLMISTLNIALRNQERGLKLVTLGISVMWFTHIFINISMTIGMFPVAGVPLPFMSYGGSMLITAMLNCAALNCIHAQQNKLDRLAKLSKTTICNTTEETS